MAALRSETASAPIPEYQGLHHNTEGVVQFWMGEKDNGEWGVDPRQQRQASGLAGLMNAAESAALGLRELQDGLALSSLSAVTRALIEKQAMKLVEAIAGMEVVK